jgi:N-acetylmuramate 1-kinase
MRLSFSVTALASDILSPLARNFITEAGWGDAHAVPLAGDASFRAYVRLQRNNTSAILMLAPPDKEAVEPFIAVAKFLNQATISVPTVLAADPALGFVLLEDLGDHLFPAALTAGADESLLYTGATDVLVHVHKIACPEMLPGFKDAHKLPLFSAARLQDEVDRVLEWHWRALFQSDAPDSVRTDYHAAWAPLWEKIALSPKVLTQFDYHSPNLMWLPERTGLQKIGVLDFQDAVRGPAAYDVVSLLQDPRRDLAIGLEYSMRAHYIAARPEINADSFELDYAILGAQRAARILGTFVRLWQRDHKPHYLQHQPRVWRYLEASFAHPNLANVRDWFNTHIPQNRRGAYWQSVYEAMA